MCIPVLCLRLQEVTGCPASGKALGRMPLLEVIPVDAAAELLDRAALVHDARRRVLLQCVQQQGGQQKGPKVVGAQGYLQSYMHTV